MKLLRNKYLILFSRIVIAAVFILAGAEKISDPAGFADSIENYRLLPIWSINIAAVSLPWVELIAGIFLLFGISLKENSIIISFLMAVFLFAVLISLLRGLNIDCGCFGTIEGARIGIMKLFENLILLLLSLNIFFNNQNYFVLNKTDDAGDTN